MPIAHVPVRINETLPVMEPVIDILPPRVFPPVLDLNFGHQGGLPASVLSVTRASAKYVGRAGDGQLYALGNNEIAVDHDAAGTPLGLLIEESRENELFQSEDFDTTWAKNNTVTVSTNTDVAPDGATTADTVEDNNGGFEFLSQTGDNSVSNSDTYCASIFVKKDAVVASTRFGGIRVRYTGGVQTILDLYFDSSDGSTNDQVLSGSGTIPDFGVIDHGDYWRFWIVAKNDATGNTVIAVEFYPAIGANANLTTLSAGATGTQVIWGAQLEEAPAISSYIKTTTVAVTRAADDIDISDFGFFNSSEGLFYAEGQVFGAGNSVNQSIVQADDGDTTDMIRLYFNTSDGLIMQTVDSGGNNGSSTIGTVIAKTLFKVAGAYAQDDVTALFDGAGDATPDTSADLPPTSALTNFRIGRGNSGRYLNGHLRRLAYWPQRPSDDLLDILTL